jgi:hypothetical protein
MADPTDKSGGGGNPKTPVPAIPRLTPAVPEPVDPVASTPRAPIAGASRPPGSYTPPQVSPVPKVAPLVAPAARPPAAAPAGRPPPLTGSFPAVPAVPPVLPVASKQAPRAPPQPLEGAAEEQAELERRYAVLDQLDYFEVMGLEPTASPSDIKRAFHHQSRTYHPDRFFQSSDVTMREQVHAVYKRVTEAYFVLRDDTRRKKYLADISGPNRQQKLRFDELAEAEAKAAVKKEVAEQIGTHPKGRQFFQVGVQDLEAGRLASAERNIKLALTYEPTNPLYLQKLEEARAKAHEEYKRSGRGFRIE